MRVQTLLAAGATLSTFVDASPVVEITNRLMKRDLELESRAVYTYQGCYTEGTSGGSIGAGKALIGKVVAAPAGGMTIDYCAQACVGYVIFGLETPSTGPSPPAEQTCYCGNRMEVGVLTAPAGDCSVRCFGDNTVFCGAYQRLSAYLINGAGAPGPTGPQGVPGTNGAAGAKGATGAPGTNGSPGAAGLTGAVGAPGTQGIAGVKGDQGLTGSPGLTGAAGATGQTGAAGTNGANGAVGVAGQPGAAGPKGDKGNAGAAGINGATGNPGAPGAVGAPGATGPAGQQGLAGTDGAQGGFGSTGETGAPGPAGPCRPVGKDMGFEAVGSATYDLPWDVSPGFVNDVVYDFQSGFDPNAGNQHALIDWSNDGARSGRFQQQDISLCPGQTYDFSVAMRWTEGAISGPVAPLCTIYFYLGSAANGFNELATFPAREPGPIVALPKAPIPADWTTFTGQYPANLGDEDVMINVLIDCDGNPTNLGQISFDTFRLAPVAVIKK